MVEHDELLGTKALRGGDKPRPKPTTKELLLSHHPGRHVYRFKELGTYVSSHKDESFWDHVKQLILKRKFLHIKN